MSVVVSERLTAAHLKARDLRLQVEQHLCGIDVRGEHYVGEAADCRSLLACLERVDVLLASLL